MDCFLAVLCLGLLGVVCVANHVFFDDDNDFLK